MRNLNRCVATLGVVAGISVIGSAAVIGCGGDDTVGETDGGQDATTDVTQDVTPPQDQAAPDADAGTEDADAAEVRTRDAFVPPDAAQDAQAVVDFKNEFITRYCQRLGTCCATTSDAGAFQQATCEAAFRASPALLGNLQLTPTDSTSIAIDPVARQWCFDDLAAYSCTNVTAAQLIQINEDCSSALAGIQPLGGPCTSFFECAGQTYCGANDAGCVPLSGDGGPCTTRLNYECEKNGFGPQALYCNVAGSATTGQCVPQLPLAASCGQSGIACQSEICSGGTCVGTLPAFGPTFCQRMAQTIDAGPDGGDAGDAGIADAADGG